MLVNFMVIGSMKCGTSTLSKILSLHSHVEFCRIKEPHFFSKSPNWRVSLDDYHSLFQQKEGLIYGEGSTTYTFYPQFNLEVWNDIYEYNPNMRFIYIIRNPIEKVISQYIHLYERGYISSSIHDALVNHAPLLNNARYFMQIKPYIETFGIQNVLILHFENLIHQKDILLHKVSHFLNIPFEGFSLNNNIHEMKSLEKDKKHHKFDDKSAFWFDQLLSLVPKQTYDFLWDKISDNTSRLFKEKPHLSDKMKNMILNVLEEEVKNINHITKGETKKIWKDHFA